MAATLTFDATDTDGTTIATNVSYTFPLTVASAVGQERLVFVAGIGNQGTADYDQCTVDGQTATKVGTVSRGANTSGNCAFITAWRAPGTSGTSINVVARYAGTGSNCFSGYCACYKMVDAGTVLATTNTAVNDPTLSTNTLTNGAVAAALLGYTGVSPLVAWTGLTERFDAVRVFGDEVFSGASADVSSGATPRTISADITPNLTGGSDDSIAGICASFNLSVRFNATSTGMTSSVGTVTVAVQVAVTANATTNLATASVGTATIGIGVYPDATGNAMTSSVGTATVGIGVNVSATGNAMTSGVGTVDVQVTSGGAGLAFDSAGTTGAVTIGNNGIHTISLAVASAVGAERLVIVAGIGGPAATVDYDYCTVDGQIAIRVGTVVRGTIDVGGNCAFITAWRVDGTSGTSIDVVVTANATVVYSGYAACFKLADGGTLLDQGIGNTNDPSLDFDTPDDGTAVAALLAYSDGAVPPTVAWTNLVERWDGVRVFGDEVFSGASANIATGSTPLTVLTDISGANINPPSQGDSVAAIGLSFNPSGGVHEVHVTATGQAMTASVGDVTVQTTRVAEFEVTGLQMVADSGDAIWVLDPPEFRSVSSTAQTSGLFATVIDAPSGVVVGDILIAAMTFFRADADGAIGSVPTGFTAIGSATLVADGPSFQTKFQMWWKRATGSEPATYTWHHEEFNMTTQLVMAAYSGAIQEGDPIETYSTASGTGSTSTATSITSVYPNALMILAGHDADLADSSAPSGATERFDDWVTLYDKDLPVAGATGAITHTNGAGTGHWQSWLLSLLAGRALSPNVHVTSPGMTASVGEALGLTGALYGWDISSLTGVGTLGANDTVLTAGPSASPTSATSTMTHGGGLYYAEVTIIGENIDGLCGFYNEDEDTGVQIDLATGDLIERPSGNRTPMFAPIVDGDVIGLAFSKQSPIKVWFKVNDGIWLNDRAQAPDSTGVGLWEIPATAGITSAVEDLIPWPYPPRVQDPDITLYEGYDIPFTILVVVPNVTFRNCRIFSSEYYGIAVETTGIVIDHCTIYTTQDNPIGNGGILLTTDYTVTNCDISGFGNGILFGDDGLISNNYIHDLSNEPSQHVDGMQTIQARNVIIDNNWIESKDTSAIFMKNDAGLDTSNITVENNTLITTEGQSYAAASYALPFIGTMSGIYYTSNRMKAGFAGEYVAVDSGFKPEAFFNIDYFTSEPILEQYAGYGFIASPALTLSMGSVHVYPVEPTASPALVLSGNYVGIAAPPPAVAPSRRAHETSAFVDESTLVAPKPAGTAEGDLMFMVIFRVMSKWDVTVVDEPDVPSGWSTFLNENLIEASNRNKFVIYYKRAGASEPADYTWTFIPQRNFTQWFMGSYRDVLPGAGAFDSQSYNTDTATTITGLSVFTTQPDDLLIYFGFNGATEGLTPPLAIAPPAEMTEVFDDVLYVAEETVAATGNTTDRVHAQLEAQSWVVQMIALRGA